MRKMTPPPMFEEPEVTREGIVFDKLPENGVLMVRQITPVCGCDESCQAELDDTEWSEPVELGKDYGMEAGTEFYLEFNKP